MATEENRPSPAETSNEATGSPPNSEAYRRLDSFRKTRIELLWDLRGQWAGAFETGYSELAIRTGYGEGCPFDSWDQAIRDKLNAEWRKPVIPRVAEYTMRDFPDAWQDTMVDWLTTGQTMAMLSGGVGSRKTTLAIATLRSFRWAGLCYDMRGRYDPGIFVPAYRAAEAFRTFDDEGNEAAKEKWRTTEFLILDDVGASRSTPHLVEQILFLLQERYDQCRRTIVTTNLTPAEFAAAVDARALSRFSDGVILDCGNKDWRQQ